MKKVKLRSKPCRATLHHDFDREVVEVNRGVLDESVISVVVARIHDFTAHVLLTSIASFVSYAHITAVLSFDNDDVVIHHRSNGSCND
ncbi:Alpha-amylase 3, chloroplastic [Dirofilaria immitis]